MSAPSAPPGRRRGGSAGRLLVRLAVSSLALAFLFSRFDAAAVLAVCAHARPAPLLAALALYLLGQAVSALRWRGLARAAGFGGPRSRYLRLYFIGMFFGLALPSTLGSDGARALLLGRGAAPGRARAFATVANDRLIGLVSLFAVAAAALQLPAARALPGSLTAAVAALGGAVVLAWLALPRLARLLPERLASGRLLAEDMALPFRSARLWSASAALSLAVHLLQIASQKLLTLAIGLGVPWGFVAVYHPLVTLAAAIPITVGGFGIREASYAALLPYAGVSPADAIALGLLWWAVGALGGLLGGVLYAAGGDRLDASG